jgi:3D (Asp-Asp-Asp) domain-containing protein
MGVLDRFERGVENVVNAAFSRSSRSGVKPIDLASALRKEADAKAASVDRARTVVPNEYDIHLNPADYATIVEWGEDALAREFEDTIHDHAEFQRYVFVGSVSVRFFEDEAQAAGRFSVVSRSTRSPAVEATGAASNARRPLIDIDGKRFHLTGETTTLGRGNEADIVVEDTGVSRVHARLEVTEYGTILTDLDSTNGTFVEDQRIKEVTLLDGNTITLGRTTIMYWDALPATGDE